MYTYINIEGNVYVHALQTQGKHTHAYMYIIGMLISMLVHRAKNLEEMLNSYV